MDEPALLYCTLPGVSRHCHVMYSACVVLCPERPHHCRVQYIVMYFTLPRAARHCNYNVGPSEQHLCDSVSCRRQGRLGHHASHHLEPCCTQADSHSGRRCWDAQVRVSNSSACQEPQSTIRLFKRITSLFHIDRVQLLPEPDAAALLGTRDEPAVLYGRHMLIDNGGGTTDIVCYQKGQT